jgi:hypothetical protein
MLASLVLGAAILSPAAPVPRDTVPPPAGPAPVVAVLRADPAGQVLVTGVILETRTVTHKATVVENGQVVTRDVTRPLTHTTSVRKPLEELAGGLATAGGTRLTPEDVAARVKDGASVLVSADGKPVDPAWLRAVDPETVVITAPSLANVRFAAAAPPAPKTPEPRLVLLAAGPDGQVKLAVYPNPGNGPVTASGRVFVQGNVVVNGPGAVQLQVVEDGTPAPAALPAVGAKKPLDEVAFDAYTADGTLVSRADALARLRAGGLALVAADNRLPDPVYLRPFRRDLLVLVSPELTPPAAVRTGTFRAVPMQVAPPVPPLPAGAQVVPRAAGAAPAPPPAKKG